jgi:hypothetical protein
MVGQSTTERSKDSHGTTQANHASQFNDTGADTGGNQWQERVEYLGAYIHHQLGRYAGADEASERQACFIT